MKSHLKAYCTSRHFLNLILAASLALPLPSLAASVALATSPLVTSSTSSVSPNIMFMLDDSGSMDWDYMPDPAKNFAGNYGFNSNHCNGVYYNPDIVYTPPVTSAGASYADASFTAAWKSGFDTALGTVNLNSAFTGGSGSGSSGISLTPGQAFYYIYNKPPGTVTTDAKKEFHNVNSTFYKECNSAVGSTTLVDGTNPVNTLFTKRTLSTTETTTITIASNSATITVGGSDNNQRVDSIKVNGVIEIMSGSTAQLGSTSTVATAIRDKINACTTTISGNCTGTGYSATVSGSVVTVIGPSAGSSLNITESGSMTFTTAALPATQTTRVNSITVNGIQLMLSGVTAYSTSATTLAGYVAASINATGYTATCPGYPTCTSSVVTVTGPASAANYTPVITTDPASGGMTLTPGTFPETDPVKLKNFANWYSYYSNRMLMMKTGVGQAFSTITDKYRVGFMTMNDNNSPDIVEIAPFNATQKSSWYTKLYASNPGNSTPLREALAHVGQLYAHKFGNVTSYTATITVGGSGSTVVTGITANGTEMMAGTTAASTTTSTVAARIAAQINLVDPSDYGASASGSVVKITGPVSAAGSVPVISNDGGGMTFSATAFTATTTVAQLNGITPADPVQFSCQQNFVILSTDGYWNGSTTYDLSTPNIPVGNQDGTAERPMYDGGLFTKTTSQTYQKKTQVTKSTSQIKKRTEQLQKQTSSLQSTTHTLQQLTTQQQQQTSTLQFQTGALQKSTDGGSTWSNTASCTWASPTISNRTITVAGTSNTRVDGITIGSKQLMKGSINDNTNPSTVASRTAAEINACTSSKTGNCNTTGGHGYTATVSGSVITITGPTTAGTLTVTVGYGSMTFTTVTNYSSAGTSCRYDTLTGLTNATGTCTNINQSANTSDGTVWSGDRVSCQYTAWSAAANVGSCTPVNQSGSSPYTVLTAVQCPTATTTATVSSCTVSPVDGSGASIACSYVDGAAVNVSSCTDVAKSTGSPYAGPATTCSYTAYTAWANASSCTPLSQSAGSPYTVGTAVNCQTTDTGWVGVGSCSAGVTGGQTVTCQTLTTGPDGAASCTSATANAGNDWTTTSCTTSTVSPSTLVASCIQGNSGSPDYIQTTCTTTTLSTSSNASSCTAGNSGAPSYITTTCTGGTGGTSDTLADVAMYYYQTDLRDTSLANCTGGASTDYPSGTNVCQNNVFINDVDKNTKQHLTTYTLGLGARGRMVYTSKDYMNDTSGDFYSVKTGAIASSTATPPVCPWVADGSICNWPTPASNAIANIDDLWHAAVNGRGTYFSATDPAALSDGLSSALSSITARKGAAAAAATSTLNPVSGNNFAYVASYTTVKWIGNLEARTINTTNGVINKTASWCVENITADACVAPNNVVTVTVGSTTETYCATPNSTAINCTSPRVFDTATSECRLLIALACTGTMPALVGPNSDTRTIYTANDSGNSLTLFNAAYATAHSSYFTTANKLSQWSALTADQKAVAEGVYLLNYLRGQYGYEDRAANLVGTVDNRIFRFREAVLGDALESQPSYIGAPTFPYTDAGYSAFVTANASRPGTVYMGTNDGMLHAFNANTGVERWAYVPSMVIPNMYKLADFEYGTKHVNFINGSPIISDFYCTADCGSIGGAASWRTILVGGLSGGGRGFYALDITDPITPTLLWEFTTAQDADLGYSFGLPIVTKLKNGTWVVVVTSGYNNTSPGDGKGYLYVLDARTGAIIKKIGTGAGSAGTPSGLAKIAAWSTATTSNVASYIYGGDLLGNVWRFDINGPAPAAIGTGNVMNFAILKDASGTVQPVTTTPILGLIENKRVVFVGTGKYLEISDLTDPQVQSLYAIKDDKDDTQTTLVNPRSYTAAAPKMVQQTITLNDRVRTGSMTVKPDFKVDRGWFVDFPDTGERVNIDGKLVMGVLLVPTIVPSSTACAPGGYGWFNYFDYATGWPVRDETEIGKNNVNVSVKYDAAIVGMNILYIDGKPIVEVVTSDNPTPTIDSNVLIPPGTSTFTGKRMQWRELIP